MKTRILPASGVAMSEVGFGTWTVATGWWGEKTDAEALSGSVVERHGRGEGVGVSWPRGQTGLNGPLERAPRFLRFPRRGNRARSRIRPYPLSP